MNQENNRRNDRDLKKRTPRYKNITGYGSISIYFGLKWARRDMGNGCFEIEYQKII